MSVGHTMSQVLSEPLWLTEIEELLAAAREAGAGPDSTVTFARDEPDRPGVLSNIVTVKVTWTAP